MNYRLTVPLSLLSFFAIYSADAITTKELKNMELAKLEELARLHDTIIAQEDFIDSLLARTRTFYAKILEMADENEINTFTAELGSLQKTIEAAGTSTNAIKSILDHKLKNVGNIKEVERIKAALVRYVVEYRVLKAQIIAYEKCLEELLDIQKQLEA